MKRNKYNVSPKEQRTMDGIVFDSKKEMFFYRDLKLRKSAHDIDNFRMQVPFVFTLNGKKMFTYIADFIIHHNNGDQEVVDVKGMVTPIFKLKSKLIEEEYQIKIHLV